MTDDPNRKQSGQPVQQQGRQSGERQQKEIKPKSVLLRAAGMILKATNNKNETRVVRGRPPSFSSTFLGSWHQVAGTSHSWNAL